MENLVMTPQFWKGRRVLVTGHTGFKGSWLSLWLQKLGASVAGYALPPGPGDSLFELARVKDGMSESIHADIRSLNGLTDLIHRFKPELAFHLAAQPLVRKSYLEPVETFEINIMGTVNTLEAIRGTGCCRAVVVITSDKCYENREWVWGYRETDGLGGRDPYSSSKGCAELVTAAYRRSFFENQEGMRVGIASARAGNVIGGGDFSQDRIVPDVMTALVGGRSLRVRNPEAIRPWQHVLEPLSGYLLLAEQLWADPARFSQSWNFGPPQEDSKSVRWLLEKLSECWGKKISWESDSQPSPHEANLLTLDSTKSRTLLGWTPRWTLARSLQSIVEWYRAYERSDSLREVVIHQISEYESLSYGQES
jgi:CDP-glucose 4,6-dehydratase